MSDYRAYLIDFNLEEYFQEEFSTWNNINKSILNPSRKSHRAIFLEELEQQLNTYDIEQYLSKPSHTYQEIENIDELITRVLNAARVKVEG